MEGLQVETAFQTIDMKMFQKALSFFKNAKSFFEKNEKKLMQEELEKVLQQPADDYLQSEGNQVKSFYISTLEAETSKMIDHISEQIDEFYKGIIASLSDEFPIEKLLEVERQINSFEQVHQ
jgi:hypothetical protein